VVTGVLVGTSLVEVVDELVGSPVASGVELEVVVSNVVVVGLVTG
jgi:hypothetical protein